MDIVNSFKNHLQLQKHPPSSLTIKNYLSDVRKFLTWFTQTYSTYFTPEQLSTEVIKRYQSDIQSRTNNSLPAARSAKRYLSSLRKFTGFLHESGAIKTNPFIQAETIHVSPDPFFFKEFKNFLFTEHASKVTIKNYMADIKQFIDWLEHVIGDNENASSLFMSIDNLALEQYKLRLLNEAKLSPVSINRKLSSLRRYVRWLSERGVITSTISIQEPQVKEISSSIEEPILESIVPEPPLTALRDLDEEKQAEKHKEYSHFGPLRLAQRTSKLINLGIDLLLFNPIAHAAEAIHYYLWKKGGNAIFAPVSTILETSSYVPKGISVKTIIPKASSIIPPHSANLASAIDRIKTYKGIPSPDSVRNFGKEMYAPLRISTSHMDWKQRLIHHLQYSRPDWYRRYHTLPFTHYLHLAILILVMVICGSTLYQTWYGPDTKASQAVLSAQDTAPPRTLSFQGRLLDNNNVPITAETPLRFALYNSPTATGAALLWQEKQVIKPNQDGSFTATLGMLSRLNQSIFADNPSLYVGISVGDNQELSPRQQIPTTELSTNSKAVEGLKPITDSPTLAQNVLLALDSSGNLTIGGTSSHTFQATGGNFTLSGKALLLTTNEGNIQLSPGGSGIIDLEKPLQNISNNIGPSGIPGAVEVDDILSVLATTSSRSALIINQNGPGDIISGKSHGVDKFRLDASGNEFIGGNLVLAGDTIGTNSTVFDIGGTSVKTLTLGKNASVLTLGGSTGITSINNNLSVRGTSNFQGAATFASNLTANGGITIPDGQKLTLTNFDNGAIPFINESNQVVQNPAFTWNDLGRTLTIAGAICAQASNGVCGTNQGTIYAASYATEQTADVAEEYISSQHLEPGDLVVIEGLGNSNAVVKSTAAYQHALLGIVSTDPGVTLDSNVQTDSTHTNAYPLALQGRVPVKVSTINGDIQPGDDLTSSSIPGVAMKATGPGQIIGRALESYSNSDKTAIGKITAFANLSYRTTETTITDNGDIAAASKSGALVNTPPTASSSASIDQTISDVADTIQLGWVRAQTISTQSLHVTTDTITIGGQTLKDYIVGIVEQILDQEFNKRLAQATPSTQIVNPIASNSAQTTDQSKSNIVEPTPTASQSAAPQLTDTQASSSGTTTIYNIYNSIATQSATASISATPTPDITDISPTVSPTQAQQPQINASQTYQNSNFQNQSPLGNEYEPVSSLSAELNNTPHFATFDQGLVSLGPTSLTDVGVSSSLSINNNLKITADAINTIGSDLNIEPLRQGNINFMGGLVTIDTQGNLHVNGNAIFAHDVAVNGQFSAGIIAPIPDNDLVINLKNKSDTTGSSLIVTDATGSGVLKINQSGDVASSGDAQFNTIASHGFSIIRGAQADTSMTQTVAQGSAGTGTITAYETQRTILTPYVTDHSLIYITPTTQTQNATPYLARQTVEDPRSGSKGSFTVAIPTTMTKDIGFNWWIVN
ncbi:MAG TPA: site-specific integrase [Candidatus Saccharimonadales bacterium]|nr:site-specific integrase [Candidatus Saccharimonadales bacterium]